MTRELVDQQRDEERKYEQSLEMMKKEAHRQGSIRGDKLSQDISDYKTVLDEESKRIL